MKQRRGSSCRLDAACAGRKERHRSRRERQRERWRLARGNVGSAQRATAAAVLLALAAHMRELPEQAEARLMTRALRLAGALTTDSGEYVWQNIWAALAWAEVIGRFEPAVVMLGDELVREGSLNALFSLPSGTLQQRLCAALVLTPEEERRCIAFAAKLWQLVEPVCIATVIREGRALVLLVDVPGLVEERINALSPELLEQMVRGIAQPYFTRVERMGWLGAVVAIPATLASRALGGF